MARVVVYGVDIQEGRLQKMRVKMRNLSARTIARDTALR